MSEHDPQHPNAQQETCWNEVAGPKWVALDAQINDQTEAIGQRIGSPKAHFTPLDVHDVDSRGEIRDLDGRPGPVSGMIDQGERPPPERRTDGRVIFPEPLLFYWTDGERILRGNSERIFEESLSEEEAESLRSVFARFEGNMAGQSPVETKDEQAIEALRALGYLR